MRTESLFTTQYLSSNLISFLYISFNSYYLKKFAVTAPINGDFIYVVEIPKHSTSKEGREFYKKAFFPFHKYIISNFFEKIKFSHILPQKF